MSNRLNENEKALNLLEYIYKNSSESKNISCNFYLDFEDGSCISINDCIHIIRRYESIQIEIEKYIDENSLDNVIDSKEIKAHFSEYEDYFEVQQAILIELYKFAMIEYGKYKGI